MLAVRRAVPIAPELYATLRLMLVAVAMVVYSRRVIPWGLSFAAGSIVLGLAMFAVWIGPDVLWPGYRESWLFHNFITGPAVSSLPAQLKANVYFITIRVVESAVLVPVLEELFWRGWLMRWLIRANFTEVPLGQYTALSFWVVAVMFAAEHGPYWEVGLVAGVAYNWWMVRTRSLADCILAHAVTNAALAAYVLAFDQWQYWL